MNTAGIIFSNLRDNEIPELTRQRTAASIPFVCRYRLIDFALSNMVNAGISDINVITHYNYRSLMDHIGSGKDWDLARRSGGIKLLPPLITAYSGNNAFCSTRLEALKSIYSTIMKLTADYVVISDSDIICNIDLNDIISTHKNSGSDITLAVKRSELKNGKSSISHNVISQFTESSDTVIIPTADNHISDVIMNHKNLSGYYDSYINIAVISRTALQNAVLDSIAHGYENFIRDIILRNRERLDIKIYRFNGYFARINSFTEYFICSMNIASNHSIRTELFECRERPIYTKVRNSPPTKYGNDAHVKNSLIADGCLIDGKVEASVLFRGVKVPKNSTVRNSILFQDTIIGEDCSLNCVVADKNVVIQNSRSLSGYMTRPYFIEKGLML